MTDQLELTRRIGEALRATRTAAGWTRLDVARAIGRSDNQVAKYEQGVDRISVTVLLALLAAMRVDPSTFLEGLRVTPPAPPDDHRALAIRLRIGQALAELPADDLMIVRATADAVRIRRAITSANL